MLTWPKDRDLTGTRLDGCRCFLAATATAIAIALLNISPSDELLTVWLDALYAFTVSSLLLPLLLPLPMLAILPLPLPPLLPRISPSGSEATTRRHNGATTSSSSWNITVREVCEGIMCKSVWWEMCVEIGVWLRACIRVWNHMFLLINIECIITWCWCLYRQPEFLVVLEC